MQIEQIKNVIIAMASQLKSNPDQMKVQIDTVKAVFPNVSEDQLRKIVEKVASPNFNPASIASELEALLK